MIHDAYIRAEIARRYYLLKGSELTNPNARKRLYLDIRDNRIDKELIKQVIDTVYKEQKQMIIEYYKNK